MTFNSHCVNQQVHDMKMETARHSYLQNEQSARRITRKIPVTIGLDEVQKNILSKIFYNRRLEYIALNRHTIPDHHQIPRFQETLEILGEKRRK